MLTNETQTLLRSVMNTLDDEDEKVKMAFKWTDVWAH